MKKDLKFFIKLLRAKQWVKNSFIFFPLLFSGYLFHKQALVDTALTFVGFCLVSSSLYVFNDYKDRHKDKLHPKKAHRPLAQADVPAGIIFTIILTFMAGGLFICHIVDILVVFMAIFYIAIHLLYNYYAKMVVIIDAFFVAVGFQIRILAGSLAANITPSIWLQICVFILALFLGFTKRRYEISTLKDKASEHRSVLAHYTSYLLDQIIIICSTLAIVFYGLYTISSDIVYRIGSQNMAYSVVFVAYGIFRYLYLIHVKKLGDEPGEILATDVPLLINVLLWIFYVGFLIYSPK